MKCPQCGAWNPSYMPKCAKCGAVLPENAGSPAAWEESMHKKKPSLQVTQFDEKDEFTVSESSPSADADSAAFDPDNLNRAELTDELEQLQKRREEGKKRIRQMKQQADNVRRSIQ